MHTYISYFGQFGHFSKYRRQFLAQKHTDKYLQLTFVRIVEIQIFAHTGLGSLIGIFDCGCSTVWKFSNFPAIQILRENNFGKFQKVKTAVSATLEGLNYDFLGILRLKMSKCPNIENSEPLICGQNGSFSSSKMTKIDFM